MNVLYQLIQFIMRFRQKIPIQKLKELIITTKKNLCEYNFSMNYSIYLISYMCMCICVCTKFNVKKTIINQDDFGDNSILC